MPVGLSHMNKTLAFTTFLTFTIVAFAGCAGTGGDAAIYGDSGIDANGNLIGTISSGSIRQAGSSTVLPIAELWADDFGVKRGVLIEVGGGGSGTGQRGICKVEGTQALDIGDMSRPMRDSEIATCRANGVEPVQWTVATDGLSVVVSNSNQFIRDLSVEQLAQVFTPGAVSTWDEVDPSFPANPITTCIPGENSGTYDYFAEVITDGEELRGDEKSEDDNVLVNCVSGNSNAIGFFGYAYFDENRDSVQAIAVNGVAPSAETIDDGSYSPLSRSIFMYTDGVPEEGTILHDYFHYAFHPEGGQAVVPLTGYLPLNENQRQRMVAQLEG